MRRRVLLRLGAGAAGGASLLACATPGGQSSPDGAPPGPPPAPLEVKLRSFTQYVLTGVPQRFLYLPEETVRAFLALRNAQPDYQRLLREDASAETMRAWLASLPFDGSRWGLRQAGELAGRTMPYLEFRTTRVAFRAPYAPAAGLPPLLYFPLGSALSDDPGYRRAWEQVLQQEVILLSAGPASPRDVTYLPTPYPVYLLVYGSNRLDQMPLPLSELGHVRDVARAEGLVSVDTR